MKITRENWGNPNLQIFCKVNNFNIGDDIKVIDYQNFIELESALYQRVTGNVSYDGKAFSNWLAKKYKEIQE